MMVRRCLDSGTLKLPRSASGFPSPSADGCRIKYSGSKRSYIDGPFAETKELIAGYTLIQVQSLQEAIEWTKRFPNPAEQGGEAQIEVRPLYELEDFGDSATLDRFRELETQQGK